MNTIDSLPKTTFSGRRFTRKQLALVQETVQTFKNLSRNELALTVCEHLNWKTPNGQLKVNSCLTLLEELEVLGVIELPAKIKRKPPIQRIPAFDEHPDAPPINDTLDSIEPVTLQRIISKEDRECWKAYLHTYHYLGYKKPFGSYVGYFIVSENRQQKLGCLLFTASAAWALEARDKFIGWEKKHRKKLLHLIISNDRFLIFPWINVPNLASKILSLAAKQIGDDWLSVYAYRPVLIETFVDTAKYSGTCYQAANWIHLGKTKGRGRFDPKHECKETIKDIYVYPLESDWQHTLTHCHQSSLLKKKYRNDLQASNTRSVGDDFVALWGNVVNIIREVALQYDEQWQVRKRIINSMLLILLIFRLVCSKNTQSYGTTIDELWDSCDRLDLSLPQKSSIAPSSFCAARKKLDESVFKQINREIIAAYSQQDQNDSYNWLGHRIFAVDGSKINLPRELLSYNYRLPSDNSHYPQGLLSCIYQLKSQMPFDFDLVSHANERSCAQEHLQMLEEDDVVVYDRGYFSYAMLYQHLKLKIHAVFRLQKNSYAVIREFFVSSQTDILATIYPSPKTQCDIIKKNPDIEIIPLQMRLIKYQIGDNIFCLGTTLTDQRQYSNTQDFIDVYHERWGVEELYKVSKRIFIIEDFHAKSERGVKQEIFAHFALITMNRIFANQADSDLNQSDNSIAPDVKPANNNQPLLNAKNLKIKTNFKNCIHVFTRSIEELLLLQTKMNSAIERAYNFIVGRNQKERPGRSYIRKSMKPESKWRPPKKEKKQEKASTSSTSKNCSTKIS